MRIGSGSKNTVRGDAEFGGHFTGEAWIDHLARPGEDTDLSVQSVYFTPGSRTAWHAHPNGQIIHVVAGEGRIQQRDGDVQTLKPGDTVAAPPGEWHWHGAAPGASMTMFAVQRPDANGSLVEWAEPVEAERHAP
jgi:quercetin dioxygenase-like cupin family protein